jgi:hypothetical protein
MNRYLLIAELNLEDINFSAENEAHLYELDDSVDNLTDLFAGTKISPETATKTVLNDDDFILHYAVLDSDQNVILQIFNSFGSLACCKLLHGEITPELFQSLPCKINVVSYVKLYETTYQIQIQI